MRSHQEAHADDAAPVQKALDHPMVPALAPEIVSTDRDLTELINQLRSARRFAYDSEFIGEQSYFPKLCLIQVATEAAVTLIDPMAPIDLMPFWQLIVDPSIQKIVHAGMPDLEPAYRHLKTPAQNVFDAQIAAGFVGLHYPLGLAKLIAELAGVELAQSPKFSQWDQRPLSARQMDYAANDVRYLPLARKLLGERLQANGTAAWADEECAGLSDPSLYRFDAESQRLRVRGVETLRPRQMAVLRALLALRESAAIEQDVPPRALLRDELVLAMARNPVKTVAELDAIRGLPRPVEERYGQAIVDATAAALADPAAHHRTPKPQYFDRDAYKAPIDELFAIIESACAARKIHPAVAASKKDVSRFIQWIVTDHRAGSSDLTAGWRHELLGPAIETWLAAQAFPK